MSQTDISCLRHCNFTQPASNAPSPLVWYTTLFGCYTKLFCRMVIAVKLLCIKDEVFCLLCCIYYAVIL